MIKKSWVTFLLAAGIAGFFQPAVAQDKAAERNVLEQMNVATSGDQVTVRMTFRSPLAVSPSGFSTSSPARVALDLAGVDNGLGQSSQAINQAFLRSANLAQGGDRLRVVFNLDQAATYQSKIDGRDVFVTLAAVKPVDVTKEDKAVLFSAAPEPMHKTANITDINFRRGKEGEARIVVDLDDPGVGVDIRKQSGALIIEFSGAEIPDRLLRKLDVNDFATPVSSINAFRQGDKVRLAVTPKGIWEHVAYQTDNQFVLELRPIIDDPNKLGGGSGRFQGERLSLRFRDYPVKEVLQAFSDFSGFNIVLSDAISGTISLNLQDVPWDQALDIILQQKNLAMSKNGSVVMIAPRDEVLARQKVASEAVAFEPSQDAIFQVNYIPAGTAKQRITEYLNVDSAAGAKSSVKIMAEVTTNKIFIKAPESLLEEVRKLLKEIDLPPRQVLIEARIVEAADNFSRALGVRLGYSNLNQAGAGAVFGAGQIGVKVPRRDPITGVVAAESETIPIKNEGSSVLGGDNTNLQLFNTANVNFPVGGGNALTFHLMNSALTRLLSLELTALEADGKGKVVSSPRVLAQNGQAAKIEDGTDIPYKTASSSGATTVSFKKATLSLNVTPTINADGRVGMEIQVNKDSPGAVVDGNTAINTKSVSTKVVVDNGGTVVIGGIYIEDERSDEQRIPFLGDLPYVGFLFKNREKRTTRTELLVFITPRIVAEQLSLQ